MTQRPLVLGRIEGGPLGGQDILVPLGVRALRFPVLAVDGFGCVEYTVTWHDDGPVAR